MAAVTAEVVIFAPPESFGTRMRMAPPPRSIVRVPWSTEKIVFAPSRAIVRSENVSSLRESAPVRTAVFDAYFIIDRCRPGRGLAG